MATKCPFCGTKIRGIRDFSDELSYKEYKISGLCQTCQDDVFGPPQAPAEEGTEHWNPNEKED